MSLVVTRSGSVSPVPARHPFGRAAIPLLVGFLLLSIPFLGVPAAPSVPVHYNVVAEILSVNRTGSVPLFELRVLEVIDSPGRLDAGDVINATFDPNETHEPGDIVGGDLVYQCDEWRGWYVLHGTHVARSPSGTVRYAVTAKVTGLDGQGDSLLLDLQITRTNLTDDRVHPGAAIEAVVIRSPLSSKDFKDGVHISANLTCQGDWCCLYDCGYYPEKGPETLGGPAVAAFVAAASATALAAACLVAFIVFRRPRNG